MEERLAALRGVVVTSPKVTEAKKEHQMISNDQCSSYIFGYQHSIAHLRTFSCGRRRWLPSASDLVDVLKRYQEARQYCAPSHGNAPISLAIYRQITQELTGIGLGHKSEPGKTAPVPAWSPFSRFDGPFVGRRSSHDEACTYSHDPRAPIELESAFVRPVSKARP